MMKLVKSIEAADIRVKKAFFFGCAWKIKTTQRVELYHGEYQIAKKEIGRKSLIFGIPKTPKLYRKNRKVVYPSRQESLFYTFLYRSILNDEAYFTGLILRMVEGMSALVTGMLSSQMCAELWLDCVTEIESPATAYSPWSRGLAKAAFESEDFGVGMNILADSLLDSGHDAEAEHMRLGKHSPACPVLRRVAGV